MIKYRKYLQHTIKVVIRTLVQEQGWLLTSDEVDWVVFERSLVFNKKDDFISVHFKMHPGKITAHILSAQIKHKLHVGSLQDYQTKLICERYCDLYLEKQLSAQLPQVVKCLELFSTRDYDPNLQELWSKFKEL